MRILVAHVGYRQRGGEDSVVDTEVRLLRGAGHDVSTLSMQSEDFSVMRKAQQLAIGAYLGDHAYGRRMMREAIERSRPQVVHFHNLYPLLGPGAMREAARLGCATVQTLHNYRMSCIAGTHYRAGNVCERCSPNHPVVGAIRGCYRGSRLQSLAIARGLSAQWRMACDARVPHVIICLTEFMRDRLLRSGAPADALVVKPNSVDDSPRIASWGEREGAVFVGRLSPEKGILELIQSWPRQAPALTVIGGGPLLPHALTIAGPNVHILGAVSTDRARSYLSAARVCVVPSVCFEGLPLVVLEAFAEATPVVGFSLGAMNGALAEQEPRMVSAPANFVGLCETATAWARAGEGEWSAASSKAQFVHSERYSNASNVAALEAVYGLASGRAEGARQ